jgi:hypothetical protein
MRGEGEVEVDSLLMRWKSSERREKDRHRSGQGSEVFDEIVDGLRRLSTEGE